ncbi:MAG: ribosome maturation factor RimM [Candidatus Latescibacterota bacterium]|nr:ribosome maturation factor RimM [Candidatus Latescibacterota bacterium]
MVGRQRGATADRVAVGYITRPKGVQGEVWVKLLTDNEERFDDIEELFLERPGQPDRAVLLERWRRDPPGILVKLAGVDSPEAAKKEIVKGYLTVPRDQVVLLPRNTYYVFEVVGCEVVDEGKRRLGVVEDILDMPSTDVYVVRSPDDSEVLVPAVRDFIHEVDIAGRRVVLKGVEGLFASQAGRGH